jgi:hypothetical protein
MLTTSQRAACTALLILGAGSAVAATYTVTSAADAGTNTLRWAINQANANPGSDSIVFNIGGGSAQTINLLSALPVITGTVTLDASSQVIELNGAGAGAGVSGLTVQSAGSTIRGLVINRFSMHGVLINGGAGGNSVRDCRIGTNAAATAALANGHTGVYVAGVPNNTVGPGNVLSGNAVDGVRIDGAAATGNVVQGNRIGTNAAGTAAIANGFNGVVITAAVNNRIGGTTAGELNVISGNTKNGIGIGGGASGNVIERNYIGLAADGAAPLGNGEDGVLLIDSPSNKIGGDVAGTFNIISANGWHGIELRGESADNNIIQRNILGSDLFGTLARGNGGYGIQVDAGDAAAIGGGAWTQGGNLIAANGSGGIHLLNAADDILIRGNRIGSDYSGTAGLGSGGNGVFVENSARTVIGTAAEPNLISGHASGYGVYLWATSAARVASNLIGTAANGTSALANQSGVVLGNGSTQNTIGGTGSARNIISGNSDIGIQIYFSTGNVVTGNLVGLGATGAALGNGGDGLYMQANGSAPSNTIGGTSAGAGNVFSANGGHGIASVGTNTLIVGNFIGTDASGSQDFGNAGNGIHVIWSEGVVIGGSSPGARNIISGNAGNGVELSYATESAPRQLLGNYIGVGANGLSAIANGGDGVLISDRGYNQIGAANAGNVIAGNNGNGVRIASPEARIASIRGNLIGLGSDGTTVIGNALHGVLISESAGGNSIGGSAAGEGNRVYGNGGDAVYIAASSSHRISGNSFSGNGGLGIDLGANGVTANDAGDGDGGANELQNFPVLATAISNGSEVVVTGSLNSSANTTFRIEFFANSSCDGSGHGEGMSYLGAVDVGTDGGGNAIVQATFPAAAAPVGQQLTATATGTNALFSTSELSACLGVTLAAPPAPTAGNSGPVCNRQTLNLTASTIAGASYAWTGPNGFSSSQQNPSIANATTAASGSYSVSATVNGVTGPAGTTSATVNDCRITINDPAAVTEGSGSNPTAAFTVTLSHASSSALSVDWASSNGTATAPADYGAGSGTITFAANTTTRPITRPVVGDSLDEDNETFHIDLANASAGSIGDARGTVTINDDDNAPTLSIDDDGCSVLEGDSGTTNCAFVLRLSAASGKTVTFNTATANGTASAGSDYTAHASTARTIGAGQTTLTVNVPVIGETLEEADETFTLAVTAVQNAVPSSLSGTGLILSDDLAELIHFDGFE